MALLVIAMISASLPAGSVQADESRNARWVPFVMEVGIKAEAEGPHGEDPDMYGHLWSYHDYHGEHRQRLGKQADRRSASWTKYVGIGANVSSRTTDHVALVLRIKDSDSWPNGSDDHIDIAPGRARDLCMLVSFVYRAGEKVPYKVYGCGADFGALTTQYFRNEGGVWKVQGVSRGDASRDRAKVTYTLTVRPLPEMRVSVHPQRDNRTVRVKIENRGSDGWVYNAICKDWDNKHNWIWVPSEPIGAMQVREYYVTLPATWNRLTCWAPARNGYGYDHFMENNEASVKQ